MIAYKDLAEYEFHRACWIDRSLLDLAVRQSAPFMNHPAFFFPPGSIGPVSVDSRTLWLSYRMPVVSGDRLQVVFEHYTTKPKQCLMVSLSKRNHRMTIEGSNASRFVLWTDTAPKRVEIGITKAGRGSELCFYNGWEDSKYGTLLCGLRYSAIDAQPQNDGSLLLNCSDGWGDADFTDLQVRVVHERAGYRVQ